MTVRVSVGLGAGDPQIRLQKFQAAASIVAPLLAQTREFQSGEKEIDWEAICEEVFGSAGYRDGGKRFFKDGQPKQDPLGDLRIEELKAKIEKDKKTGNAALLTGLSSVAKVALGRRELEADVVDRLLGRQHEATRLGFEHGHKHNDQHLSAMDHGHRHGLALAAHKHQVGQDERSAALLEAEQLAGGDAGTEDAAPRGGSSAASAPSSSAGPQGQPSASPPPTPGAGQPGMPNGGAIEFVRDPKTQRIVGARITPTPAQEVEIAPPAPEPKNDDEVKKLTARIAELEQQQKPKRVVRDAQNRIVGVE